MHINKLFYIRYVKFKIICVYVVENDDFILCECISENPPTRSLLASHREYLRMPWHTSIEL